MTVLIITGLTLSTLGKVILGVVVIKVHGHLAKERKIDYDVVRAVRAEKRVGLAGIGLIIAGYFFEVLFYFLSSTIILY